MQELWMCLNFRECKVKLKISKIDFEIFSLLKTLNTITQIYKFNIFYEICSSLIQNTFQH